MKTMNIYAEPGSKVIYAYPDNGHDSCKAQIRAYELRLGAEYTVERTSVGQSSSYVFFREFPGIPFGTSNFRDATEVEDEDYRDTWKWVCTNELRWYRQCLQHEGKNASHVYKSETLQQLWRREDGKEDWRDVPTIKANGH